MAASRDALPSQSRRQSGLRNPLHQEDHHCRHEPGSRPVLQARPPSPRRRVAGARARVLYVSLPSGRTRAARAICQWISLFFTFRFALPLPCRLLKSSSGSGTTPHHFTHSLYLDIRMRTLCTICPVILGRVFRAAEFTSSSGYTLPALP